MPATRPIAERFWEKVRIAGPDECWIWIGTRHGKGYGQIKCELGSGPPSTMKAHRVSWELAHGPIPGDLWVLHHCDNPPCVNPAHLFLGTNQDNSDDRDAKGRRVGPTGKNVHTAKLTEEMVRSIRAEYVPGWGGMNMYRLSEKYGVTRPTIGNIIRRKIWKHVL